MLGEPGEVALTVITNFLGHADGRLLGRDRLLPLRVRSIITPRLSVIKPTGAFDGVADLLLLGEDLIDIGLLETFWTILIPSAERLGMV
uniref:hypothetical protein n=1 Tax=Actinomyces israelii TaxID=1659 RepID=UPI0012EB2A29|nr:hypothetical protein [Actinomyces israelii]